MSTLTRIALLRGVNVGTAKRIAMADLRALVERLGYREVRTLLNSGNVVFSVSGRIGDTDVAARIETALARGLGVTSRVIVLSARELAAILRENPLGDVANDPSRLVVMVLADRAARARLAPLVEQSWSPEMLALGKRSAYAWHPGGIARSVLSAAVGRALGNAVTSRNIATLRKLLTLAED